MNYADLPPGYVLYYLADYLELIAPDGKIVNLYAPSVRGEVLIREAWEHRAKANPCTDWDCPICEERGLIA